VRSFSTNSRPALRAAASGGRPRPATPPAGALPPDMVSAVGRQKREVDTFRQLTRSQVLPGKATITDQLASSQLGAQDGATGSKRMVSPVIR
jgi:hypothetical protein